ncbi:hypothetical protein RJT34_03745 [Clitoria ternatea]|uniref:Bifunctional inhibitor/plant lipid transfer protein/seed storage helical domain-containing protein n=1 Tax=Clitoria ternatea TaxID=43366 RepID=A0AAN9KLA9_CLITE
MNNLPSYDEHLRRRGENMKAVWLWLFALAVVVTDGADLATKCNVMVEKVIPCLNFATGQVATPSKDCCDATSKIKESDPECLCYVIQQTHKGSPEVKSMGIQEARLLHLPIACNLKNASTTHCPKLLGLSPNSPDAAIFTNTTSLGSAPTSTVVTESEKQKGSYGSVLTPYLLLNIVMIAIGSVSVSIYS